MASLHLDSDKQGYRLSFRVDGRKTSIWLGSMKPSKASIWKEHVEDLLERAKHGDVPSKAQVIGCEHSATPNIASFPIGVWQLLVMQQISSGLHWAIGFDTYIASERISKDRPKRPIKKPRTAW